MQVDIKNRWTGAVIYTAELSAEYEIAPPSAKLGAAVEIAVKAGADLTCAYLAGARGDGRGVTVDVGK